MLDRLKKQNQTNEAGAVVKKNPKLLDPAEFIPFAGFYDAETLITKNGELAKIIQISSLVNGLTNEGDENFSLRNLLRASLGDNIKSDRFSFYFATRRYKQKLTRKKTQKNVFASKVSEIWHETNGFENTYHNVCYITVLIEGQKIKKLFDKKELAQSTRIEKNRRFREDYLSETLEELSDVTSSIVAAIAPHFTAEVLAIAPQVDEKGREIFYSQQLKWLSELIALRPQEHVVGDEDLSSALYTHELVFGFNAIESRGKGGKRFAAVMTLKHYHELPFRLLDRALQIPSEMIITQAIDFMPAKEATVNHREFAEMLKISKDSLVANASGVVSMLEAHKNMPTDYVRQQTIFMVLADEFAQLETSCGVLQEEFGKLGLVLIREDIRLEEVFWAQIPGNFTFLKRQQPIAFNKAAGFIRLNNLPIGSTQSKWGEYITVFPTSTQTPYLFNFHDGENAHMAFLDYNSFPDRIGHALLHFLISQASGTAKRTIIFDSEHISRMFVQAMGGKYEYLGQVNGIKINPFLLEDNNRNRGFIAAWISHVLNIDFDDNATRMLVKSATDKVFTSVPEGKRRLEDVAINIHAVDANLAERFVQAISAPEIASWVTSGEDGLDFSGELTGIDLPSFVKPSALVNFAFPYLMHRLIACLNGEPTVIVLREAFALLENSFIAPRLSSLLEMFREQNAIVIFHTRNPDLISKYSVSSVIMEAVASKIMVPDDVDVDYLPGVVGLPEEQVKALLKMQRQSGDFLLYQGGNFIPSAMRIDAAEEVYTSLVGDEKPAVLASRKG